jgi:hypothetical protein
LAQSTHLVSTADTNCCVQQFIPFFLRRQNRRRSRYISAATRRAVIARDLKGEKYDPSKRALQKSDGLFSSAAFKMALRKTNGTG